MITTEQFNELYSKFHKTYKVTKKNLSSVNKLSLQLIEPIESIITEVGATECREGCTHCCNLRVVAFPHEIISIYLFLKNTLSKGDLREIKEKILTQYSIIEPLTKDEHFTTNVECPLLINNKCSVYPVRPISCAGYHSLSEAVCIDSNNNPEIVGAEDGGIPQIETIQEELSVQHAVATQVIERNKDDVEQYELIMALYNVFKKPALIQKWKSGRKLLK